MLVLGRKINQSLDLIDKRTGELIARVTYADDRGPGQIAMGVDAEPQILVLRSELTAPRARGNGEYRSQVGRYPS